MTGFLVYLVIINMIAYYFMRSDKRRAKQSIYRFPERVFFIIALLGGSIGVLVGMYHCNHKRRKLNFVLGIPFILFVQVVLGLLYIMNR